MGKIDDNSKRNVVAEVITNIKESRDLEFEQANKGKFYKDIEREKIKDWITSNAAFMSENELSINMKLS